MTDTSPTPTKKPRIFCVDLLRGLDIFYLLCIGYGLLCGGVFQVWPLKSPAAIAFWRHSLDAFAAPGHVPTGFGLMDFTQPLFVFVTGVSASLAFRKFVRPDGVDVAALAKRLLSRTLLLWLCGSCIRGMLTFRLFTGPAEFMSFCFYSDTLHTIAVAYFAASVGLLVRKPWVRLALGLGLVCGMGVVLATCGDYSRYGNAARLFEEAVYTRLGGHSKDFCYLLTTFTWAGMGILASLAGDVLKGDRAPWSKARLLAGAGAAAFAVGWVLSFWIPPIRYIYTVSFVFETQGLALLLLAGLFVLTDIWNVRRGLGLLILFGQCSLAAWMICNFFDGARTAVANAFVGGIPTLVGSSTYQPLILAVAKMLVLVWAVWTWRKLRDARRTEKKA